MHISIYIGFKSDSDSNAKLCSDSCRSSIRIIYTSPTGVVRIGICIQDFIVRNQIVFFYGLELESILDIVLMVHMRF